MLIHYKQKRKQNKNGEGEGGRKKTYLKLFRAKLVEKLISIWHFDQVSICLCSFGMFPVSLLLFQLFAVDR